MEWSQICVLDREPGEVGKWKQYACSVSVLFLISILSLFLQGNVENGRDLIKKGIKMREELGVPLYTAAGNCDLGSE